VSDADVSVRWSVETLRRAVVERRFRRDATDLLTDMSSKSDALSSSPLEWSTFFFLFVMVHREQLRAQPVGSRIASRVRVKKKVGRPSPKIDDTVTRVVVECRSLARPSPVPQRDKSRSVTRSVTLGYKSRRFSHFNATHFGRALLSPCAVTFFLSRRSLQHVQEKVHLQLEYPPVFRAPVTDGVMFLTGDDTTMTGFSFSLELLLLSRGL
jgi:hypothetical protein